MKYPHYFPYQITQGILIHQNICLILYEDLNIFKMSGFTLDVANLQKNPMLIGRIIVFLACFSACIFLPHDQKREQRSLFFKD